MNEPLPRECPPAEMLAAFLEGKLNAEERAEMARHVETCPECVFLLKEAGAFEREEGAASGGEVVPFRGRSRWWLAAAAVVIFITGAVLFQQFRPADPVTRMMAFAGEVRTRPVEPRISGIPWAPVAAVTRGSSESVDSALLRLRGAAGEVLQRCESSVESMRACAFAHLLTERPHEAVRILETLVAREPESPALWSDLGAARFAAAMQSNDSDEVDRALREVEHALSINPQLPEALFNRALILESKTEDASAWERYLAVDSTSPWAQEAQRRVDSTNRP